LHPAYSFYPIIISPFFVPHQSFWFEEGNKYMWEKRQRKIFKILEDVSQGESLTKKGSQKEIKQKGKNKPSDT
jgi:hypothetical protein